MTTYANWVCKTANLFADELGLDARRHVLLDLPPHWLGPVFLGAAWSAGWRVTTDRRRGADVVVCGPDGVGAARAAPTVLACSLRPFAVRFAEPLPAGVLDYGMLWAGQSDVVRAASTRRAGDAAPGRRRTRTQQATLLDRRQSSSPTAARLLTDAHPATAPGVPAFLAPLAAAARWCWSHPDDRRVARSSRETSGPLLAACPADQPPSVVAREAVARQPRGAHRTSFPGSNQRTPVAFLGPAGPRRRRR